MMVGDRDARATSRAATDVWHRSEADVTASEIEAVRLGLTRFRLRTPLGEALRSCRYRAVTI
ncbi:MAG: hypothetical protein WKF84_17765 [Pyrinomonadaceae bacterium]